MNVFFIYTGIKDFKSIFLLIMITFKKATLLYLAFGHSSVCFVWC